MIPKFCTKCGRRLRVRRREEGYDKQTGLKIQAKFLECPQRRFLESLSHILGTLPSPYWKHNQYKYFPLLRIYQLM